jgi:hypothetical protein
MKRLFVVALLIVVLSLAAIGPVSAQTAITYGETVQGELTSEQTTQNYTFEGTTGDRVVIAMASAEFDTRFALLDPAGAELISDDDGGYGTDSLLVGFELPIDGPYTIAASSYGGSATGPYGLFVGTLDTLPALELDSEVEVEDAAGLVGVFSVTSAGEQGVTFNLVSPESSDAGMVLYDAEGSEVAQSNFSSDGYPLGPTILGEGSYILVAAGDGPSTITAEAINIPSLEDGPATVQITGLTDNVGVVRFAAVAGETVRFTVTIEAAEFFASPTIEITQPGEISDVAYISSIQGVTRLSFDIVTPSDGVALVTLTSFSDVEIEISLEHDPAE